MLFDAAAFEVNVNDFSKRNDPDAFERFLLDEIIRLNDGAFMTAGGESPAGKDEEALIADEAAFQANLNQGYILCYTELANLYRGDGLWPQCLLSLSRRRACLILRLAFPHISMRLMPELMQDKATELWLSWKRLRMYPATIPLLYQGYMTHKLRCVLLPAT